MGNKEPVIEASKTAPRVEEKLEEQPISNETKQAKSIDVKNDDINDSSKDLFIETKASKKKNSKSKSQDKVVKDVENGAFPIKLKKAEPVKRPIEESKMEAVQLKHHTFEGEPQEPELEEPTSIILISKKGDESSEKIQKNKTNLKKEQKENYWWFRYWR